MTDKIYKKEGIKCGKLGESFNYLIIGPPRSGKTFLLRNLIENKLKSKYDFIQVFSPNAQDVIGKDLFGYMSKNG